MKPTTDSDGYRTVTPYLKLPKCERLLEFLKGAFNARESCRLTKPDGTLLHAEVFVGDTLLMIHEMPVPSHWTPKPCTLYLRVQDIDSTYQQALAAGAVSIFEPADMYYGERVACITDVAGNDWWIATSFEKLTLEKIQERATAFLKARVGTHTAETRDL